MRKLLLATTALLAIPAMAQAATLEFIYSEDGGVPTTVISGTSSDTLLNVTTPNFTIDSLVGTTQPSLFGGQILSGTSIDVSSNNGGPTNPHTLHLTINGIGITGISGLQSLESSFDSSQLTSGWQVSATTDINGTLLAGPQLFVGTGSMDFFNTLSLTDPFNVSLHWDITDVNGVPGGANVGTVVSAAPVPGPIVGAGLPGLVTLLGGGWFWRRRRKVA